MYLFYEAYAGGTYVPYVHQFFLLTNVENIGMCGSVYTRFTRKDIGIFDYTFYSLGNLL